MTISVQCVACTEWADADEKTKNCPRCGAQYGLNIPRLMQIKREAGEFYSRRFTRLNQAYAVIGLILCFAIVSFGRFGQNVLGWAISAWMAVWISVLFKFSSSAHRKTRLQPQFAEFYGNPRVRE